MKAYNKNFRNLTQGELEEIVNKYNHKRYVRAKISKKYFQSEKGKEANRRNAKKNYYRKRLSIMEAQEHKTANDLKKIIKYNDFLKNN